MQILGVYNPSGKFLKYADPIKVTENNDQLVDGDLWVWGLKNTAGEWISARLLKIGIESKLKVDTSK